MAALCAALLAFSSSLARAQNDPPLEAGRISFISGAASVQPAGLDDWGQAEVNMPLGPGDRIVTDQTAHAEIQIGRTYIRLGSLTDISIIDISQTGISIGVAQGNIHLHNYSLWPGQGLHVNTPSGSASLYAPGELRVDVYADQPAALFTQYGGTSYLNAAGGYNSQQLPVGSALELIGTNPVVPQWLEPAPADWIDNWSRERDLQIDNSLSYRYVSADIGGAYDLDASGDWVPQSPYGAIWFPHVGAGWAPYHSGHWVSHAPWGWVWVEQESWGYTPFHYGRWVVFNGRWGWVPGPPAAHPVWSPALVVFAGGINVGGGGVSAWFPLGPGEPYRPWYPCSPTYINQVNITNLTATATIHIQASYVGFNFGAVVFANRAVGITAISQADFAAGRPVTQTNVVVINKTVINNITIINNPPVQPNPRSFVSHAPERPVPVAPARPAFVDEKGMTVSAKVGFKPAPPPVRPVPQVQAPPGHKAAAPPRGVPQSAPAGKPAVSGSNAPAQGGQGPHPASSRPAELTAKPATNAPAPPAPKAEGEQSNRPAATPPAKAAETKPGQKPKPATKPEDKDKPKKDNPDDKN
jgi:hypothetical protein